METPETAPNEGPAGSPSNRRSGCLRTLDKWIRRALRSVRQAALIFEHCERAPSALKFILDQRTALCIGSANEVDRFNEYLECDDEGCTTGGK
jgi:hypothetical protein